VNHQKKLLLALCLSLTCSCKVPSQSSVNTSDINSDLNSDSREPLLSEKSSQKCGVIGEDLQGSYMEIPSEAPIYFKPQNEASLIKLKSFTKKETCIIADFSDSPVALSYEHLIQPKNQTLCGVMTKDDETFYFKPDEDLITYEISTGNENVTNLFQTQLNKPICMTADFRGQEVKVTSLQQLSETKP
jgi:hypothetical protein